MATVIEKKPRELEGSPSKDVLNVRAQALLPKKMGLLNGLSRETFRGRKTAELKSALNLTKVSLHFIEREEYNRAIACFDKILQIDPKCHQAWNNKGVCYLRMGDDITARKCFEESIKLDREYRLAWINKSLLDYKAMIKDDDVGDALVKLATF